MNGAIKSKSKVFILMMFIGASLSLISHLLFMKTQWTIVRDERIMVRATDTITPANTTSAFVVNRNTDIGE
jgi:hypothetical protein